MVARVCAVEYICRMHGGSQAKLVRCSDGKYYVVKFQNNPQGAKTLANELLATLLAKWLGLPVPEPAIVEVHPDLIQYTDELIIEQRHRKVRCRPGLCFGSLYANGEPSPSNPIGWCKVLPEGELGKVHNAEDFLGMLVFNKWVGNMDTCQTTFVRNYSLRHPYHVLMIDQGLCFNGTRWNFPDSPRRGLYPHRTVYANVLGMEAFGLWLMRLDRYVNRDVLDRAAEEIPPEWYGDDSDALARLLARLDERRKKIRDLLLSARKAAPEFFPAWLCSEKTLLRCPAGKQMDHSQQFSR